jgi:hypothetical protein
MSALHENNEEKNGRLVREGDFLDFSGLQDAVSLFSEDNLEKKAELVKAAPANK